MKKYKKNSGCTQNKIDDLILRAVLDTNVLVSAIISDGKSRELLKKGINKYCIVTSDLILKELVTVLRRPKFKTSKDEVHRTILALIRTADVVSVKTKIKAVKEDPKYDMLIETALDGEAKIIIYNLQKIAHRQGKAVIAATTHNDLQEDLKPSVLVRKRFGEEIKIDYYPNTPVAECSLIREMTIEEGTKEDWQKLSRFHYRGHKVAVPRKIFRLVRGDELCGVIVYSYPPPACYGRRLVLPRMSIQEINKQLSIINRVVIHPKYRTVGLGAKLIRETMALVGT